MMYRTAFLLPLMLAATASLVSGCKSDDVIKKNMFGAGGPSGTDLVAMAFDPDDADRRREGINQLSKKDWGLREPHLKGYATLLKSDTHPLVRGAAVRALGRAGMAAVAYLPEMVAALNDADTSVRWDAAVALDRVTGSAAITPLSDRALSDKSVDVRISCTAALKHYRTPEVAGTLARCLGDESFSVRHEAHESLVYMTGTDMGYDPVNWQRLAKATMPVAVTPKREKAWWDWMGVAQKQTTTQPAGGEQAQMQREWWDWMGVAQKQSASTQPAEGDNAQAARPWWDWMGTTDRKTAAPAGPVGASPASQPAGSASQPASAAPIQ